MKLELVKLDRTVALAWVAASGAQSRGLLEAFAHLPARFEFEEEPQTRSFPE